MEISKNPEREELERSVQMFMFGVEKRARERAVKENSKQYYLDHKKGSQ